jgi:protein-S-isoprenylcysteine O-methyltransferase Ste14
LLEGDVLRMTPSSDQPYQPEPIDRRRLITSTVASLLVLALCLFVPAGTLAWFRGWLFFAVIVTAGVVISLYLRRVNPEIIAARANRHEGTKPWDRWVLAPLLVAMVAVYPVAALDDGRFHWSHLPWLVCGIGYVLVLAGLAGMTWAQAVNKHFEPTVRIQADRGHKVIDTGPYAIVRHPGYVAAGLLCVGIPLALGSFWALIPAVISYLLLVVRTALEDRTLRAELPGYREYAQRVRYRLVPGIW